MGGGVDMEEEIINLEPKKSINTFFYITLVEITTVVIVLVSVLILKSFFKDYYVKFFKWYDDNILAETNVADIIEETDGDAYEI